MRSVFGVKIRDLSAGGALIEMPAAKERDDSFGLLIVSDRLLYPAVMRWRRGTRAGLEFTGKPRLNIRKL